MLIDVNAVYCGRQGRVMIELQKNVDAGVDTVAGVSRRGILAVQCRLRES